METRAAYWQAQVEARRLTFRAAARAFAAEVAREPLAAPLRRVARALLRRAYRQARWQTAFLDPASDSLEATRLGARMREEDARVRAALSALWTERDSLFRPLVDCRPERSKELAWVKEAERHARAGRLAFVRRRAAVAHGRRVGRRRAATLPGAARGRGGSRPARRRRAAVLKGLRTTTG